MRPRVFPAEDIASSAFSTGSLPCFNEAAGIPRGRRPRVPPRRRPRRARFNEAAGIPRGRRGAGRSAVIGRPRFNEAAGIPRGRQLR